jgi:broad specificity phosphatase PhoE
VIYLVRHGETVWNTVERYQGARDSPLTARGLEQADRIGLRLAEELAGRTATILAQVSPLGRARETAARIAGHVPLTFQEEPRLREVTLGSWDGMTRDEIAAKYSGALTGADQYDWYFRSPDGESFAAACDRARSWLTSLTAPVVAVSHGLTGRLIRGLYLGLTPRAMLAQSVPQEGFFILRDGRAEHVA